MADLPAMLELLQQRLPPLVNTDLNERTISVWGEHWMEGYTVRAVAQRRGWCVPAVEFHLRRARKILE